MYLLSLLAGSAFLLYCVYKYFVFPAFLSPLSKVPSAHFSSPFSPLWILLKRHNDLENQTIHQAHAKYGDIVRLGPNEVSIACVDEGIKTVYSGGFEKWNWYSNQFSNFGVPSMFSTDESKPHSIRKRTISNVYSKSFLQSSPEMHKISQHMLYDRLFPILQTAAASEGSIEVVEFFSAFAMDFINAYLFGLQNASDFMHDAETRRRWLELYQSRRPYRFWVGEMPGFIKALKRVGIHILPKWYHEVATRQLEDWVLERCNAAAKDAVDGKPAAEQSPLTTTPVVYKQLVQSNATASLQGLAPFPQELRVATEIMDHLAAGHETAGITLTYLFHELSLHPVLQTQIRHEFLTLSPRLHYPSSTPTPTLPDPRTIDALPILHACLMETLRIHAAIPGPQPRITPSTPTSLAGSAPLPPGVRVSAQAYTLHRNSTVFPEPEVWKPERWLEASEGQRAEMGRWFWAFGSGGRMCIGSNFAMQEMKLITAAVYTNYSTHIVDDEGIEQVDAYTAHPRANKLTLRFERLW